MGILPIIPCRPLLACALVAALAGASHSSAQESHEIDASDLAKQTQNPVADLVALPFQFNFNNGGDFADRTFLNLNFQPVIPFSVCDSWKAVARTIIPINSYPTGAGERSSGIGDIQEQLYFTPAESGALIWGI
ncbi:MAG TPA: hypothetical protein VNM87_05780, partial [Candidatus Udaeobacter sp.]|nr:hypothetical protein [Candidatus Udaeobacter sp.]